MLSKANDSYLLFLLIQWFERDTTRAVWVASPEATIVLLGLRGAKQVGRGTFFRGCWCLARRQPHLFIRIVSTGE